MRSIASRLYRASGKDDVVLITHLHGDYFGGIPFLIVDGQFSLRSKRLFIAGPPGFTDQVM